MTTLHYVNQDQAEMPRKQAVPTVLKGSNSAHNGGQNGGRAVIVYAAQKGRQFCAWLGDRPSREAPRDPDWWHGDTPLESQAWSAQVFADHFGVTVGLVSPADPELIDWWASERGKRTRQANKLKRSTAPKQLFLQCIAPEDQAPKRKAAGAK